MQRSAAAIANNKHTSRPAGSPAAANYWQTPAAKHQTHQTSMNMSMNTRMHRGKRVRERRMGNNEA